MRTLYNIILVIIMFCFMVKSFVQENTNLLIFTSALFIHSVIFVCYEDLRQKYKDEQL